MAFYGSLFAIAGADGDIEKDEVAAIFETLDTAKMSEAGRQKLYAFLFEPPLFDENLETLAQCPSELHYGLVVAMMEVALTDGELTDQEKGLLQRARGKFAIAQEQMDAIEKYVREVLKVRVRGIEDNVAIEGLKAAVAGLGAVGVPLAAVYFSGAVVGFTLLESLPVWQHWGLVSEWFQVSALPSFSVRESLWAASGFWIPEANVRKNNSRPSGRRRGAIGYSQSPRSHQSDHRPGECLQEEASRSVANEEAIRVLTERLKALQRLLAKRKLEVVV